MRGIDAGEDRLKLGQEELELFLKLHPALLFYANQQLNLVDGTPTLSGFMKLRLENKMKVRDALYDHTSLIDSFIAENPFNFSAGELEIIAGWRHLVKGTFYLLRYHKRYAVFLDDTTPPRAYGVLALTDTFEEILGSVLPIRLEAVLLSFKGQIVYDGFLVPYSIFFGRGIREELNEEYQEAKNRFGVITSLPPVLGREKTDAERLKFYLRNESNRLRYEAVIEELTRKDFNLMKIYHQEMGKIHARELGKQLREIGLSEAWFAILEGTIIASGATKEQVNKVLKDILPIGKRELPYIFHLRKK